MDSVAELVRQGGYIIGPPIIVDQDPGGQAREGAGAKSPGHLAGADLRVEMAIGKHAAGMARQRGGKGLEAAEHHVDRLVKGVPLV
jgi:hypothetical protein